MKVGKKLLSVFLAVIMIMSSMSVCFGCVASAANNTNAVSAFVSAVQCDAMKNMTSYITTAHASDTSDSNNKQYWNKWIYTAPSYEYYLQMRNVVLKLHGAIMGLDEYGKYMTHANGAKCSAGSQSCADTGTVLTALKNAIGTSTYNSISGTYKITDLLSYVLSTSNYVQWKKNSGQTSKRNCPAYIYNILELKTDLVSYLKHFSSPSAIDADEVDLSYSYTMTMCRQSHGGRTGLGTYYHNSLLPEVHKGPESGTTTSTNKATLVEVETALTNNKDYLGAATWADVHKVSTDPATLKAAATAISGAKTKFTNAVGSTNAATLFDHYFNNDNYNKIAYANVDKLVTLINESATVAGYKSSCETIKAAYNDEYANNKYKTYTSTEVNALYNKLKTAYEGFKAADDNMEASIATYYGINGIIGDVPNALDALLAYYYEIFLGSIDERAFGTGTGDGYVAVYQNWTIEDIDNDVITSADILKALNEVTLDIDTLEKDATDADIQGFFGMSKAELIEMLTTVKTHLEGLGYYAGLNDQLYAQYATFTNDIVNVINADSAKLYSVLSGYEQWHKNLQNFFTTWSAEVGEYKELLEDDLQDTMNAYMREAYTALKERVVGQIENAYGLYEVYYDLYENNVTMASLTYFNTLKKSIEAIEHNAYNWMKSAHYTYGTAIDDESIRKYDALQVIYGAYGTFVANRGFDTYVQTTVDTVREDTNKDIARENENGKYVVEDSQVNEIIDLLESALKDPAIAGLLGNLINKENLDAEGNPKPFNLAEVINGLIEGLYTDNLVSTIASFIYPIVAKAFLDVWEGINPFVDTTAEALGQTLKVKATLDLYDVEAAIESAGIAIAPINLANKITARGEASKYAEAIALLKKVTTKTSYDVDGNYNDPWKDEVLFKNAVDEDGNPVIDETTNEVKKVYAINWGVDSAAPENKRAAFIDAASAALSGLEPLLYALLLNQKFVSPNTADSSGGVRGGKIGVNGPGTQAYLGDIGLNLTLDPITLMFEISACDGYDNVLAPLFELLGLENIPHSEDMKNTKDFLEDGLFAMIDQLVAKVAANPIETILDIIPNLVYALEADLIAPILNFLAIEIYYEADAHYSAVKIPVVLPNGVSGNLQGALKAEKDLDGDGDKERAPEKINLGEMLDLESLGLNLSGGLAGILEMLNINLPNLDVSVLATAGELVWKDTNRSKFTYSYAPAGKEGKAAHIVANRADLLEYLFKWAFGNLDSLLALLKIDTSTMDKVVTAIFTNLAANANDATAGVVELLNQKVYNTLETYEWYTGEGYVTPTNPNFTPSAQIYMNPGNDWTEAKAQYLYDNLEGLLASIFTLAKLDLDKETPEVDVSIEGALDGLVGGLLSDKTLTALAGLLAKLDLNALLAGDAEDETATVAEGEEATEGEAAAVEIDVNALVKNLLGIDLAAVAATYAPIAAELEANPEYVYDFGVDAGTKTFAAALADMVAPLGAVLDFILTGGDLAITFAKGTANEKAATLIGYDGYNNAIIPLLEALGCTAPAQGEMNGAAALEATVNALVALIDKLTTNTEENAKDGAIYTIIDLLPGLLYFIASDGLTTTVRNLLQPVYVILDTIRPIYDLDIAALIAGIEIGEEGKKKPLGLDLNNLGVETIIDLVANLTGLNLTELKTLIYDVCKYIGTDYTSKSTLAGQTTWKKGAYNNNFSAADMLTVVLSFVLEWATVADNAAKLDELLKTNGLIAKIGKVFADVAITYGTPNWGYWFENQDAFDAYLANPSRINTLASLDWENIGDNDWDYDTAAYFAENLDELVDTVIAMINKDKVDEEGNALPTTLSALLSNLVNGLVNADTLNDLVGMIAGLLEGVDDNLLELAGYILGDSSTDKKEIDIVGLKAYKCKAEINDLSDFINELANVLDTYASGLVNWLFFGDDFRFAKKSDNTDTIVINGGEGYAQGLAMILEALGCELPEEANTKSVLGALATRVDAILADPIDKVIALLPNLVYFLNANGAGVAVDNLLKPVNALLTKLQSFGLNVNLNELIGIDLANLSLANVVSIVEGATGLPLDAAEKILVNFCTGTITKGKYIYKMNAAPEDTITILLVVAFELLSDNAFGAKLDEMLKKEGIAAAIKGIFNGAEITYATPNWDYNLAANGTVDTMKYAITYPNNWSEATAKYVTYDVLLTEEFDKLITGLIDANYESLGALLTDKVNVFTSANLQSIVDLLANLLKDIDDGLLDAAGLLLDVDVVGLKKHEIPADIDTVEEFAAELAIILNAYAKGVVEWLLLGNDYRFFVKDVAENEADEKGLPVDFIVINGAEGYANGLALLLEALGCTDLPAADGTTDEIVTGVLKSLAARISAILANPIEEVINLLPNLLYFLNTNGVAVVVKNTTAALTALLKKLEVFGIKLDLNELVNLKKLMKIENTDAKISLDNLTVEALLEAVSYMVEGLDLTLVKDVIVNFGLVEAEAYTTVSNAAVVDEAKKMGYEKDVFEAHDMVTVLANLVLLTIVDEDNAEFVKGFVGAEIYQVILNLLDKQEADIQEFSWLYTDKEGEVFSTLTTSGAYDDWPLYGPHYTEEMATYIADNFGMFVDNILYLLGLEINGVQINDLTTLINELLDGSLYNSSNVIAIRDALAGVLANVEKLEVKGVVVGGYIADVLKAAGVADIKAVATVEVPTFSENREMFVTYLCKVLEPLYGVLKYVLANEDISFFVDTDKTDLITLQGAEGYVYGIIPILEVLGCSMNKAEAQAKAEAKAKAMGVSVDKVKVSSWIVAPEDYYAMLDETSENYNPNILITSILDVLLDRVDEIIENPADEILGILPNLIYFINSNGLDTVVKNTLNAVYSLLGAIEPIAKIDIYDLIGVDLAKINMNYLVDELLKLLAKTGYNFTAEQLDPIAELTVGKLEKYTSVNGKTAYRMVYAPEVGAGGGSAELVTVILRLAVTFLMHEKNATLLVDFLSKNLGMSPDARTNLLGVIKAIAKVPTTTYIGMDQALAVIYYLFYSADIGAGSVAGGLKDINAEWGIILKELSVSDNPEEETIGSILKDLMDKYTGDVLEEDGVAPNGLIKFFQKIADWFNSIIEWFKNLFK